MLIELGIDSITESVYRLLLSHPSGDVQQWAAELELPVTAVQACLDRLSELALVSISPGEGPRVQAVHPLLGLEALLARQQAELVARQQQVEEAQAAAAELVAYYAQKQSASSGGVQYLDGIDAIRSYIVTVHSRVREEFLTFAPGGPQTAENMHASRPLNVRVLGRGVQMRTVYLDSIRRDRATMDHAQWLESLGATIRTAPTLPNRFIIHDGLTALIAADTGDTARGALVVTNPGVLSLLRSLFEQVWQASRPLNALPDRAPGKLTAQQAEVLRQMAQGRTDEAIAASLGVSTRTVRRIATNLLQLVGAQSRLQAGVHAVQRGYLPATPQ
ncbi:LuxR C-terminal-related transcriptional regulator [Streptomyces sp. NPDC008163]|uniref:LuxR C-terminal-related transcriptional regulator n=1 Tax=Streptomyces sp. NPDC008163 TaxID=3364818 RepID=UPI0036E67105